MMNVWILLGAMCFLAGFFLVAFLFLRKIKTLCMLDVDSSQVLREKRLRNKIMEDRMQRALHAHMSGAVHFFLLPWRFFQKLFRRLAGRLLAIERRYHRERARDTQVSQEDLQAMLMEAERALREGRYQAAEERLVELISAAPKFAQAYEVLSRVYGSKREWKEALESLSCFVKLSPQDPEGRFLLGGLFLEMRDSAKAFDEYARALTHAPHNPKYLDAYIALALDLEKYPEAFSALTTLREVNPDNGKIADFSRRLESHAPDLFLEQKAPRGRKKRV